MTNLADLIIVQLADTVSSSSCQRLTNHADRCWLFVSTAAQTWNGAAQTCTDFGGQLAVAHEDDVRDAIEEEVGKRPETHTWWIGLRNSYSNFWFWSQDEAIGQKHTRSLPPTLSNT